MVFSVAKSQKRNSVELVWSTHCQDQGKWSFLSLTPSTRQKWLSEKEKLCRLLYAHYAHSLLWRYEKLMPDKHGFCSNISEKLQGKRDMKQMCTSTKTFCAVEIKRHFFFESNLLKLLSVISSSLMQQFATLSWMNSKSEMNQANFAALVLFTMIAKFGFAFPFQIRTSAKSFLTFREDRSFEKGVIWTRVDAKLLLQIVIVSALLKGKNSPLSFVSSVSAMETHAGIVFTMRAEQNDVFCWMCWQKNSSALVLMVEKFNSPNTLFNRIIQSTTHENVTLILALGEIWICQNQNLTFTSCSSLRWGVSHKQNRHSCSEYV